MRRAALLLSLVATALAAPSTRLGFATTSPVTLAKRSMRSRGPVCASIGWDTHKAVEKAPESLVKGVEGNESMRRRFERACREAQVRKQGEISLLASVLIGSSGSSSSSSSYRLY